MGLQKDATVEDYQDHLEEGFLLLGNPKNDTIELMIENAEDHPVYQYFEDQDVMRGAIMLKENTLKAYRENYGEEPPQELLIAAASASKNSFAKIKKFIESATETDSSDVTGLQILSGLIEPIMLQTIAAQTTVSIYSSQKTARYYQRKRLAASARAGVAINDDISEGLAAAYSSMQQRLLFTHNTDGTSNAAGTPDAVKVVLTFTIGHAIKKNCKIYLAQKVFAEDNGSGAFNGTAVVIGATTYTITGSSINYATGAISITTDNAIPAANVPYLLAETDLEEAPTQVPKIKYKYSYEEIEPHDHAISAVNTLMAKIAANKAFGHNLKSLSMTDIMMIITKSIDVQVIRDQVYMAQRKAKTLNKNVPAGGAYDKLVHGAVEMALMVQEIDGEIITDTNGDAGFDFAYAGPAASQYLKALAESGRGIFKLRTTPISNKLRKQPHFIGILAGRIKVFEIPAGSLTDYSTGLDLLDTNDIVCGGVGTDYFSAGYITGNFTAPFPFSVMMNNQFREEEMLFSQSYAEMRSSNHYMLLQLTAV